ncbi:hypothetical protein BG004_006301 [Podila humilis]|nr:hypothetical protein BG004_006301 [Podila humilis]
MRHFDAPEAYKAAVLKNKAFIRTIRLRQCDSPMVILDIFASCTHLEGLTCDLKFELASDVMSFLDLVDNNPLLKSVLLSGIPVKRLGVFARLVQVLSEHPSLKKISEHMFKTMLNAISPNQETFETNWVIQPQHEADGLEFRDEHVPPPAREWSTHRAIKRIVFKSSIKGYEHSILAPFLAQCPELESLQPPEEIPEAAATVLFQAIHNHCPKLKEVTISRQAHEVVISSMILGCHALETFAIDFGSKFGPRVFAALTSHVSTLTSVAFGSGTHISSTMIQQVLSTCRGLKRATFDEFEEESFVNVLGIKDMVISDWICKDSLECLHFTLGLDYGEQAQDDIEARREVIRKAYRQLGQLTKSSSLSFGHHVLWEQSQEFPLHEDRFDFDMRVATGMDEMKDMKALRTLDLTGLPHRVGMDEMIFMHENWPLLEECAGLWNWEGEEMDEGGEEEEFEARQEAIDWMVEQRPAFGVY